jgi:hypothetical protein
MTSQTELSWQAYRQAIFNERQSIEARKRLIHAIDKPSEPAGLGWEAVQRLRRKLAP